MVERIARCFGEGMKMNDPHYSPKESSQLGSIPSAGPILKPGSLEDLMLTKREYTIVLSVTTPKELLFQSLIKRGNTELSSHVMLLARPKGSISIPKVAESAGYYIVLIPLGDVSYGEFGWSKEHLTHSTLDPMELQRSGSIYRDIRLPSLKELESKKLFSSGIGMHHTMPSNYDVDPQPLPGWVQNVDYLQSTKPRKHSAKKVSKSTSSGSRKKKQTRQTTPSKP